MIYSIISFIWNLSGLCLLAAIIYFIHYGLCIVYEKMIAYFNIVIKYFYPVPNQITLEKLKEEVDNFDGWKIIQNKDMKKLKEDVFFLKKDIEKLKIENNIIKQDNEFNYRKLQNEILNLRHSINTNNAHLEKKTTAVLQDIKNINDLEFKEMNNKIFKIKCIVDK